MLPCSADDCNERSGEGQIFTIVRVLEIVFDLFSKFMAAYLTDFR